jgi:thioredoxin 1
MKTIENNNDYEKVINQEKPVLLDFYADWCGPCQSLLPTVEKLSEEYQGKVEIQKVNVDENRDLAIKYGVRSIPALFFIKDTEIVDKLNGLVSESVLKEKIEAILNRSK